MILLSEERVRGKEQTLKHLCGCQCFGITSVLLYGRVLAQLSFRCLIVYRINSYHFTFTRGAAAKPSLWHQNQTLVLHPDLHALTFHHSATQLHTTTGLALNMDLDVNQVPQNPSNINIIQCEIWLWFTYWTLYSRHS